jgi:hypothetical protein
MPVLSLALVRQVVNPISNNPAMMSNIQATGSYLKKQSTIILPVPLSIKRRSHYLAMESLKPIRI